ncbi:hypothetical protein K488DRAFT_79910 [Vararia minispora EC-137]|uniref:Uncharacterized protein n=1 Tax=Vararia minispora EC-137 TaxID=1314806 RepID=A0ACB8QE02_9AGAM|nr:hypothetical protein K488DRAFT_79910 [Vararia minispora EC-137]
MGPVWAGTDAGNDEPHGWAGLAVKNFLDPLSDTSAPRYALESDDEDEINPLPRGDRGVQRAAKFEIKASVSSQPCATLIVASGNAGKFWARGAHLGEQGGSVFANDVTVGMMFTMKDTSIHIVVSEATTRLPVWAMHSYAETILDFYRPKSLILLDTYAVPTYISSQPFSFSNAPARFLQTKAIFAPSPHLQPFGSPNLVHSTSAAFMAIAALRSLREDVAFPTSLLLLPSQHLERHRPTNIVPSLTPVHDTNDGWSAGLMSKAHYQLLQAAGQETSAEWKDPGKRDLPSRRLDEVGESGMYM